MNLKYTKRPLGQYLFENHDFDGSTDDFLNRTAPFIGYIVHSFNSLDEELNSTICKIINDRGDEPGAIIIYKLTFMVKVDLLYRLGRSLELASEKEIPSFKVLISNLTICAQLRNAVVHAEWENMDNSFFTFVKLKFEKDGMKQHYTQFTPESLEKIDEFIHNTYLSFDKFENEKQLLFD